MRDPHDAVCAEIYPSVYGHNTPRPGKSARGMSEEVRASYVVAGNAGAAAFPTSGPDQKSMLIPARTANGGWYMIAWP